MDVSSFVEESHALDPHILRQFFELYIVKKYAFALRLTEVCCVVLQICPMRLLQNKGGVLFNQNI